MKYVNMPYAPGRVRETLRRRYAILDKADRKLKRSLSTLLVAVNLVFSFRRADLPASRRAAEPRSAGVETFVAQYTNYALGILNNNIVFYDKKEYMCDVGTTDESVHDDNISMTSLKFTVGKYA